MNTLLKSKKISELQKNRIGKSMYESIYLLDIKFINKDIEMIISGSTLNIYTVKLIELDIYCNCPDIKFKNTFCKHICFVICTIGKIYNENLFIIKKLLKEEKDCIILRLNNISTEPNITNLMLIEKYKKINFIPINLEDDCSICYNPYKKEDKLYTCQICSNTVHKECMKIWLESGKTCIFCRTKIVNIEYVNIAK